MKVNGQFLTLGELNFAQKNLQKTKNQNSTHHKLCDSKIESTSITFEVLCKIQLNITEKCMSPLDP